MKFKQLFSFLFRKYSFFRVLFYLAIIAVSLVVISFVTVKAKKTPSIDSITPTVGTPGDTMVITGSNFGSNKGSNYVEIGGNRITASNYLTWSDNLIKIILPSNIQDGLIIVVTKNGRSKPGFFANETGIPVAVPPNTKTLLPFITSVQQSGERYGNLMTISGSNFGSVKGNSKVYFTASWEEESTAHLNEEDFDFQFISASEKDFDYEYWTDSEIHVRIPEGAASGNVFVETEKGKSNFCNATVNLTAGTKKYTSRKTYVVQMNSDIENMSSKSGTNITLRIPRPIIYARQPSVQMTECSPSPVIDDYRNTVIQQIELQKATSQNRKHRFNNDFLVTTYAVQTSVNPKAVRPFSEKSRVLYKTATESDFLINKENSEIEKFARSVVGKETNPYSSAKLIYDYMIQNFELSEELRKPELPVSDLITQKKGDAYDFSIVYATALRILGIPCYAMSGILVDSALHTTNHWWCEFYIENFGWIPVDLALGKGMPYKAFRPVENSAEFYFGNLDGQHIAFSRGWNEIKQSISQNSKIVYRPKTYALQSIWEESSEGNVNYSSLWNDPGVLGVY